MRTKQRTSTVDRPESRASSARRSPRRTKRRPSGLDRLESHRSSARWCASRTRRDRGGPDGRAVRFPGPSTSRGPCVPHSVHSPRRFVDESVAVRSKFVDKAVAAPGPPPYGSSCPKGPSQRTGEARGDPRSAAGPVGRIARFAPAGPPIRDTAGRDHIKVRRSQGRHRSWSVPSGVFVSCAGRADTPYTPVMPSSHRP